MDQREQNLRRALSKCLERLHDYFGLTEKEMQVALDDAATNTEWSPHDDERWKALAYEQLTSDTAKKINS